MLLDLVDEDDRVADDHAGERQDTEDGDKAHGLVEHEHADGHADDAERRRQDGQDHVLEAAQLEHQERHDEEHHDWYRLDEEAD